MGIDAQKVIATAERRRDFVKLEDGYVYYWPCMSGAFSAWILRVIADELDRLNADWNKMVQEQNSVDKTTSLCDTSVGEKMQNQTENTTPPKPCPYPNPCPLCGHPNHDSEVICESPGCICPF